jgi:hypothetical protein
MPINVPLRRAAVVLSPAVVARASRQVAVADR